MCSQMCDFFKVASITCASDPHLTTGSICFQSPEKSMVKPPNGLLLLLTSCRLRSRHLYGYLCPWLPHLSLIDGLAALVVRCTAFAEATNGVLIYVQWEFASAV